MKNVIWSLVTVVSILCVNWGLTFLLEAAFIEYAFFTGLIIATVIRFFNSSGGIGSSTVRMNTQAQTGIKIDEEKKEFNPTVVFYTAVIYTILAAIVTFFYYWDYLVI
ncbi:hypothetical protein [Aquibacillus rhizosphaerae]|uniref:DUF3899 domain-containing protein n=1 Tax=Aquibacillus rhizosphaerae TaxID=3051431 RepID=A0ABT7LCL7_9BACI|nr:hypothetical protein [Aquibacillus sp. LR5S19]MDL4842335.1 hypothetical protein [Aquibacillus sp. LR5S19]